MERRKKKGEDGKEGREEGKEGNLKYDGILTQPLDFKVYEHKYYL